MKLLIRSAKIVDPGNKDLHLKKRDILVREGKIVEIGQGLELPSGYKEIERPNLHVSKGWFDSSISFGEPGYEERETLANGLYTAARSGYTEIVLNPDTKPIPDSSSDILFIKKAVEGPVNPHPMGALTVGSEGKDLAELYDMSQAGAVAFYDYKRPVTNPNLLKIALQYTQNFNAMVLSFPLDQRIAGQGNVHEGAQSTRLGLKGIPALAEELQLARDLYVLEYAGGKLHVPTVSTAGSVKLIREAKKKGLSVSCSVALHNLVKGDDLLENFDSNYKVLPPLRSKQDRNALKKALEDGTIDLVTTDHKPLNIEEKRVEFEQAAYGSLGLENAFGSLNQLFGLERSIDLLTRGRKLFGLSVPEIKEGVEANLCLFNPTVKYTLEKQHLLSTSHNSMYLGDALEGMVYGVIAHNHHNL